MSLSCDQWDVRRSDDVRLLEDALNLALGRGLPGPACTVGISSPVPIPDGHPQRDSFMPWLWAKATIEFSQPLVGSCYSAGNSTPLC